MGNLTRKKRKRDERSFVVPDSVLVGARAGGEYENALDPMQQEVRILCGIVFMFILTHLQTGGLVTPADGETTDIVKFAQARDKFLSVRLDQVSQIFTLIIPSNVSRRSLDYNLS